MERRNIIRDVIREALDFVFSMYFLALSCSVLSTFTPFPLSVFCAAILYLSCLFKYCISARACVPVCVRARVCVCVFRYCTCNVMFCYYEIFRSNVSKYTSQETFQ